MITETRESRTRLLHTFERYPRRRHHTLDNATLDKFNFICVPLHIEENPISTRASLIRTTSNECLTSKSKENASPVRRVRFKFDDNQQRHSPEEIAEPKKFSLHRVEYQIPIHREINPHLGSTAATAAKTRAITTQKIEMHHLPSPQVHGDSPHFSTADSNHQQTQWYKDMYGQIHQTAEKKQDETRNPYQPTYTFPTEFDGSLEKMERYMRRAASEEIAEVKEKKASSIQTPSTVKDQPQARFDNPITDRPKSATEMVSSSITINPNPSPIRTTDTEHRSVYKRILRGGDIPSTGLQKYAANTRDKSNERDAPETDPQKTPPQTKDFQPIYKALALHNFYAQTDRELSFKKGETILVKRRINDDWLEGQLQGSTGIFPLNHVELFPYETTDGEGIAKYDFVPKNEQELALKKGDKVTLLRKLENNWYEGRIDQFEGSFPGDYIDVTREPTIKMPKSVLKTPSHLQQTAVQKLNIVPELSLPLQRCQVLYDYTPKNSDELEIHVGDIIQILEMCDDGWYCGIMERSDHRHTNAFGTFPGNYVKILPL